MTSPEAKADRRPHRILAERVVARAEWTDRPRVHMSELHPHPAQVVDCEVVDARIEDEAFAADGTATFVVAWDLRLTYQDAGGREHQVQRGFRMRGRVALPGARAGLTPRFAHDVRTVAWQLHPGPPEPFIECTLAAWALARATDLCELEVEQARLIPHGHGAGPLQPGAEAVTSDPGRPRPGTEGRSHGAGPASPGDAAMPAAGPHGAPEDAAGERAADRLIWRPFPRD